MFYTVGHLLFHNYIFDTEDGSCELVEFAKLGELGIKCPVIQQKPIEVAKIKMLYHFVNDKRGIYYKDLVDYTLTLKYKYADGCDISDISLRVYLLCDNGEYCLFLNIHSFCSAYYNRKYIEYIENGTYSSFNGLRLPECMLGYIIKLAEKRDLDGIFSAFDGILDKKLFDDCEFDVLSGVHNIVWR